MAMRSPNGEIVQPSSGFAELEEVQDTTMQDAMQIDCPIIKEDFWGSKFAQRDLKAKQMEDSGEIVFEVVTNDGSARQLKLLSNLKTLIGKLLPYMPKAYIARIIYDKNHHSMVILKNDVSVIGGCTFRLWHPFCELVFLAIAQECRQKGFGTRTMSQLKEKLKKRDIGHILTYADDFAVGYFKKQGFRKEIRLDKKIWKGKIKDYENSTLMHCMLATNIDYLEAPRWVRNQRMKLYNILKQYCNQHNIYKGLNLTENGLKKTCIRAERLSSIVSTGWDSTEYERQMSPENQRLLKVKNRNLLDKIVKDNALSWPFLEPVANSQPQPVVDDYLSKIENPMDLGTIRTRLENNFYITEEIFFADLQLVVDNCKKYNPKDTEFHGYAVKLEKKYLIPNRPKSTLAWHALADAKKKQPSK